MPEKKRALQAALQAAVPRPDFIKKKKNFFSLSARISLYYMLISDHLNKIYHEKKKIAIKRLFFAYYPLKHL